MSDNYYLRFKNVKAQIDKNFFDKVIGWFVSNSWKYLNFWVAGDEIKVSLDEAASKMPQCGTIVFMKNHHDLSLNCYLGNISLDTHPVNFEKNDNFTDLVIEAAVFLYLESGADRLYGALPNYEENETEVSWFNIFNPTIAKKISEEKIERINAYRVKKLKNGALLLVLSKSQRDISDEEREKIKGYLFG